MEAMNIKEFYESFNKLESPAPEEIAVEHNLFEPHSLELTNESTTTNIQEDLLTGFENINYLNEKPYLNSRLSDNNYSFNNGTHSSENTNFLPIVHPAEKYETFSNQYEARNGHFTYNKTSRKFNDRLERIFNGSKNLNFLPNCQFSTTSQTYGIPNDQHVFSKSFTNHNGQLGSTSYNLNSPKIFSPSQALHSEQLFTHQNGIPGSQHNNKTNNYEQMENIFSNSVRPSTSRQATANQHCPMGNISINIGNMVSSLPRQNAHGNHYETANMEENNTFPVDESFMNSHRIISQNHLGPRNNRNTILSQRVFDPNVIMNGLVVIPNQDIKENLEQSNDYNQGIDVSKIMDNIPFQEFSNMNGNLRKFSTNPSININNINRINVHVHHPSNASSMSGPVIQSSDLSFVDQRVPLMSPQYASPYSLYSTGSTVSPSPTMEGDCCSDASRSVSTNQCLSEAEYTYINDEPIKDAIRDDIYLPTSEGSFTSADIDEWLNTIQLTPLETYSRKDDATNISTQSEQINPSSNSALKKKKRRSRTKINQEALNILKMWFQTDPYPNHAELETIAEQVGHTVTTVRIWFQNRRQTLKKRVRAISNENTAPMSLSTEDSNQQDLTTQLYSAMEYPASSNALKLNDDNLNYSVQIHGPLTAYQDKSFVQ